MKKFTFAIAPWNLDLVFKPIRTRADVIVLLMKIIKIMDVGPRLSKSPQSEYFELIVDRMSRLFFFSEGKHFSISFPFNAIDINEALVFRTSSGITIDSQMTSDILGIMSTEEVFTTNDVLDFADPISDYLRHNAGGWPVLRELLMHEDGYIRYDHDPENEDGHLHPLHHFDVFYGSNQTFKIGVDRKVCEAELIDALNIGTNCYYLNPAR